MNVAAHQDKEKNEKTGKRKAREDRPILKRLHAIGVARGAKMAMAPSEFEVKLQNSIKKIKT